jgi:hypothetical protein
VTPLDEVPSVINAGDSYDLLLEEPDYPATAGWSLRLVLNGPSALTKDSVASGEKHALTLTTANTAGLAAGLYRFVVKAINGSTVTTVRNGISDVKPDLATAPAGTLASWAEQALAAVEAAILGAASDEMRMFMIDGRQVQKYSFDELLRLRVRLKTEVATEQGYFGVPIVMTATGFSS